MKTFPVLSPGASFGFSIGSISRSTQRHSLVGRPNRRATENEGVREI